MSHCGDQSCLLKSGLEARKGRKKICTFAETHNRCLEDLWNLNVALINSFELFFFVMCTLSSVLRGSNKRPKTPLTQSAEHQGPTHKPRIKTQSMPRGFIQSNTSLFSHYKTIPKWVAKALKEREELREAAQQSTTKRGFPIKQTRWTFRVSKTSSDHNEHQWWWRWGKKAD